MCEEEHLFFTRYHFKEREGLKFRVNWHHVLICDEIDKLFSGETENLCISVSPGSSKTELVVVNIIARGLALNPRSRFLHLCGSDSLASLNSSKARDIILSDEYQALWPMKIPEDTSAKKRWNVEIDGRLMGGVYATAIGGQVTGFRAGHMTEGFQGAILIDDPIKPEDAFSRVKVDAANRKLLTTVQSRKANPKTPIVLIMQRVGERDPVAFVEGGALAGKWKSIRIPAILDEKYLKTLDPKYRALMDPDEPTVNNRFSYWAYKEPLDRLLEMERGNGIDQNGQRMSRHVFTSQYQQAPVALGGNVIHGEHFTRYTVLPKIKWRKIFADTAQKTKERNDFSVFEEWGYGADGKIYLLDLIRGKWEAPELQRRAIAFWSKARGRLVEPFGQCRSLMVEDKSSGTGLVQTLSKHPYNIPIKPIEREKDKLYRLKGVLAEIELGLVAVPEEASYTQEFIAECEAFTEDDSHDFDDQVDPMIDAIVDMLQSDKLKQWAALADKKKPKLGDLKGEQK